MPSSSKLFLCQFALLLIVFMSNHYSYKHKYALALREEGRMKVFLNRLPGNTGLFRAKRNEAKGCWRKLDNEEPYDFRDAKKVRVIK